MIKNKIINGEAVNILNTLDENSIDLVVFSPPYDNIRVYEGFNLDLDKLGRGLFRVLKEGGVCCMVINDQTVKKHKTLTTFKTITSWCDDIGFKLFECCIYQRDGVPGPWWQYRFRIDHEYMPIFYKGNNGPKSFNKDCIKIPCKGAGNMSVGGGKRTTAGHVTKIGSEWEIPAMRCRGTIWDYRTKVQSIPEKRNHPAVFPDSIPYDFIRVFSKEGDIVLDPMSGSGSTAIMAKYLKRDYIGIDISENYCEIARKRIDEMGSDVIRKNNNIVLKEYKEHKNLDLFEQKPA